MKSLLIVSIILLVSFTAQGQQGLKTARDGMRPFARSGQRG